MKVTMNKAFCWVLHLHYIIYSLEQPHQLVNTIIIILYILYPLASRHLKNLLVDFRLASGGSWSCEMYLQGKDLLLCPVSSCKSGRLSVLSLSKMFHSEEKHYLTHTGQAESHGKHEVSWREGLSSFKKENCREWQQRLFWTIIQVSTLHLFLTYIASYTHGLNSVLCSLKFCN